MSDIVIRAENLGKKYTIGHQAERGNYTALRDVLMQNARTLWNKTKELAKGNPIIQGDTMEEMWALKDVNFEIRRGEAMGIIGRNGAGKSTLLKILSRITEPSAGRVTIKGRVASLLEVGTGFHPELSGRENIYLNGTILGMTRLEIKKKFDEIVSFAEVEKYLDTPVKRYSSGMYVRLAFAVAAHLQLEILVIDEVLAVGDAAFQKKCLGKMGDATTEGRTVIFVSHNMGLINDFCTRVVLLQSGTVIANGLPEDVTLHYLSPINHRLAYVEFAPTLKKAYFTSLMLHNENGEPSVTFDIRKPILLRMQFITKQYISGLQAAISVFNSHGNHIFYHSSGYIDPPIEMEKAGNYDISVLLPGMFLTAGAYTVNVALHIPNVALFDRHQHILEFEVEDTGSKRYDFSSHSLGCVLVDLKWEIHSHSK
jgi:lipopolysaccharide transport system ATP-binding protein